MARLTKTAWRDLIRDHKASLGEHLDKGKLRGGKVKSITVKDCGDCHYSLSYTITFDKEDGVYCALSGSARAFDNNEIPEQIPDWCPLEDK